MPEYKNNSREYVSLKNSQGNIVQLEPGKTLKTWFFWDDDRLQKIADHPLFPRTPGINKVTTSASGVDVAIAPRCDYITVEQITGTIDVFADVDDSDQQLIKEKTGDDPIKVIECFGTIGKLIIKGSGDCVVYQHRRVH